MNKSVTQFERDFKKVAERFPKLNLIPDPTYSGWTIEGELDICDMAGDYWGTFDIKMRVAKNYPHCIPSVMEISTHIPRDIDWHISESGICCLDIPHKLILMARKGIVLDEFITQKIYSYFANQLFKLQTNTYAGDEYAHNCLGIQQFYREELAMSANLAQNVLKSLVARKPLNRNEQCYCGSGRKLKYCHLVTYDLLKNISYNQLKTDLLCFQSAK